MRAAVYTRISLDRDGQRAGVQRQKADCEALCARKGWTIVGHHEDNDRSAFTGRERPAYARLVASVATGDVDVIVAWHHDRLWRNVLEQQTLLALGRQTGLQLVATPHAEFDPADGDDSFMSTLLTAVAQKESSDKSRRMRRRQEEKLARGEFHGGPAGFGYRLAGEGRLKVEPTEAALVRDAAKRVLAGQSTRSICLDWNRRNVATTRGGPWRVDTIAAMLQTPRIAGLRTREDGSHVPGQWEPIIDTETHEQILAVFDARRRGPRQSAPKHLLSGMVRCGRCGAPMTVSVIRDVLRYRCQPKGMGGCGGISVVASLADDAARDLVLGYLDSDAFSEALRRAQEAASGADGVLTETVEQLRSDRANLANIGDLLADGTLEAAEYRRLSTRLKDRIAAGEHRLTQSAPRVAPAVDLAGRGGTLRAAWAKMTGDERRIVLAAVVDRFAVNPATPPTNRWNPERIIPAWRFE